ncbi:9c87fa10-234d-4576-a9e8-db41e7f7705d [Thermothielavioides terrestris]|uniref:9c87fa10-234d-4576-a9e8-db41e7f7705d n=1 Tax=Thermothielavioides terrestris TaxID=2587410 RepID=A0A446BVT4_9PEZI|nr:9c87fa10-234d-4576-a9e8-db41e7f7705d [Thermothielavioides terrestris]
MGDADDPRLAPFYEESSPKPGESMADFTARDQIRRCELILERPLTEAEADIIRSTCRELGRRRASSEVSEPATIHSPPRAPFQGGEGHTSDNAASAGEADDLRQQVAELRGRVEALEAWLEAAEQKQPASGQGHLDEARADIAQLRQEKEAVETKLASVELELQALKAEAVPETDREPGNVTHNRGGRHPSDRRAQGAGYVWSVSIALALLVLAWVVPEAVLHSKRLSEGYGPYINGGYNGLV